MNEDEQQKQINFLQTILDWLNAAARWVHRLKRKIENEQASGKTETFDGRM